MNIEASTQSIDQSPPTAAETPLLSTGETPLFPRLIIGGVLDQMISRRYWEDHGSLQDIVNDCQPNPGNQFRDFYSLSALKITEGLPLAADVRHAYEGSRVVDYYLTDAMRRKIYGTCEYANELISKKGGLFTNPKGEPTAAFIIRSEPVEAVVLGAALARQYNLPLVLRLTNLDQYGKTTLAQEARTLLTYLYLYRTQLANPQPRNPQEALRQAPPVLVLGQDSMFNGTLFAEKVIATPSIQKIFIIESQPQKGLGLGHSTIPYVDPEQLNKSDLKAFSRTISERSRVSSYRNIDLLYVGGDNLAKLQEREGRTSLLPERFRVVTNSVVTGA